MPAARSMIERDEPTMEVGMNDPLTTLAAELHAMRLVLAHALAMAPIDLEDLAADIMGRRQRAAARAPAGTRAAQPAVDAAVDRLLEAAGQLRRRPTEPGPVAAG
jgi:hypothetical protein